MSYMNYTIKVRYIDDTGAMNYLMNIGIKTENTRSFPAGVFNSAYSIINCTGKQSQQIQNNPIFEVIEITKTPPIYCITLTDENTSLSDITNILKEFGLLEEEHNSSFVLFTCVNEEQMKDVSEKMKIYSYSTDPLKLVSDFKKSN